MQISLHVPFALTTSNVNQSDICVRSFVTDSGFRVEQTRIIYTHKKLGTANEVS